MLDVFFLSLLGIIGYFLRKLEFQLAPLVIGLALGPLIEKHLREGLFMKSRDFRLHNSPIAVTIWLLVLIILTIGVQRALLERLFGSVVGRLTENKE